MGEAISSEGGGDVMFRRKGLRSCVWEGARLGAGAGNAPPEWAGGWPPALSRRLFPLGWAVRDGKVQWCWPWGFRLGKRLPIKVFFFPFQFY